MKRVGDVPIDVPVFWSRNRGGSKWKTVVDDGDNDKVVGRRKPSLNERV